MLVWEGFFLPPSLVLLYETRLMEDTNNVANDKSREDEVPSDNNMQCEGVP